MSEPRSWSEEFPQLECLNRSLPSLSHYKRDISDGPYPFMSKTAATPYRSPKRARTTSRRRVKASVAQPSRLDKHFNALPTKSVTFTRDNSHLLEVIVNFLKCLRRGGPASEKNWDKAYEGICTLTNKRILTALEDDQGSVLRERELQLGNLFLKNPDNFCTEVDVGRMDGYLRAGGKEGVTDYGVGNSKLLAICMLEIKELLKTQIEALRASLDSESGQFQVTVLHGEATGIDRNVAHDLGQVWSLARI